MFDAIKRILGRNTCRGCLNRRLGGLYCGFRGNSTLKPSAWQKDGCWLYIDAGMVRETASEILAGKQAGNH